ncbi:MAG TPA: hypothetical protein PK014_09465 [Thermoanaerobaculia bacterium]|nr:hypothetical protein [Thermoanaerobaculia bacterium]HUM30414.1 hypothetical protein [Thermoanaerobaculia bacterium]HXK68575.1 hypothetical protein [Thermoanaerobaculia bacterium]
MKNVIIFFCCGLFLSLSLYPADCPEVLRRWPFGPSYSVGVDGNIAYFGSGASIIAADVTDPQYPIQLSYIPVDGIVTDIEISGSYLIAAIDYKGVVIVDISNPEQPVLVGRMQTAPLASAIDVKGEYIYLANYMNGLRIIDWSDPTNPFETGHYDLVGYEDVSDVVVSGSYAYLATSYPGLLILDISDPSQPQEVGSYQEFVCKGIAKSGDIIIMAFGWKGLRFIDVSDPTNPVEVSAYSPDAYVNNVSVMNNTVLFTDHYLMVLDISDPHAPVIVGSSSETYRAEDIVVSDNKAFIAASSLGLRIFDLSEITYPCEVGFYDEIDATVAIKVSGNIGYVASYGGLHTVDITETERPNYLGTVPFASYGTCNSIEVVENLAYVAAYDAGLQIVDVSDPENPMVIGSYSTEGKASGVVVSGEYAFISDFNYGLRVISIADPTNPEEVATYSTSGGCRNVTLDGNVIYLSNGYNGVNIIDISDPHSPRSLGRLSVAYAYDVACSGPYAYAAIGYPLMNRSRSPFRNKDDYGGSLRIYDVSNPAEPIYVGQYRLKGQAVRVEVSGDYALVSVNPPAGIWDGGSIDEYNGMSILNVTDPSYPVEMAFYTSPGVPYDVTVHNDTIILAEGRSGFEFLSISGCTDREREHTRPFDGP